MDRLGALANRVDPVHADYKDLPAVLAARGIERVQGTMADLGVSSMQFDAEGRGFSFRRDEPLDMRMDRAAGPHGGGSGESGATRESWPTPSSASAKNGTRGASHGRWWPGAADHDDR